MKHSKGNRMFDSFVKPPPLVADSPIYNLIIIPEGSKQI